MGKVLILMVCVLFNLKTYSQELPLGYIVHFKSDFSGKEFPEELLFSKNSTSDLKNGWLVLSEKNDSINQFIPNAVALIDNNIFGEYIVSFRIKPEFVTNDSISAFYMILGMRDSSNYYYVSMSEHVTSFCSIYKGINKVHLVDSSMTLMNKETRTFKVKRNILDRKITIVKNGDEISFTDPNLVMGYFGFGVENAILAIDEVTIWAPTSNDVPAPLFKNELLQNN
jgi:hypothetical protein